VPSLPRAIEIMLVLMPIVRAVRRHYHAGFRPKTDLRRVRRKLAMAEHKLSKSARKCWPADRLLSANHARFPRGVIWRWRLQHG
jgi:hypothetical protein